MWSAEGSAALASPSRWPLTCRSMSPGPIQGAPSPGSAVGVSALIRPCSTTTLQPARAEGVAGRGACARSSRRRGRHGRCGDAAAMPRRGRRAPRSANAAAARCNGQCELIGSSTRGPHGLGLAGIGHGAHEVDAVHQRPGWSAVSAWVGTASMRIEAVVIDLLHAAGEVELHHAHGARVAEIGVGRIVERDVAVHADAEATPGRWALRRAGRRTPRSPPPRRARCAWGGTRRAAPHRRGGCAASCRSAGGPAGSRSRYSSMCRIVMRSHGHVGLGGEGSVHVELAGGGGGDHPSGAASCHGFAQRARRRSRGGSAHRGAVGVGMQGERRRAHDPPRLMQPLAKSSPRMGSVPRSRRPREEIPEGSHARSHGARA